MDQTLTVLDGGLGRELLRMGAPFRQPEWSALALFDAPEFVTRAHTSFIAAGADVITTNSYALVPFHIGENRFSESARSLAALSGRCARQAVDAAGRSVSVAGSLPPLFGSYRPDLFEPDAARALIDPLVAGLADYVDVWLGETLGSIAEARAVRDAIDRGSLREIPLWISYTLDDDQESALRSGESVDAAIRAAIDIGATAVLFNCCDVSSISRALEVAAGVGSIAFGGYANRFVHNHTGSGEANDHLSDYRDDLSPLEYRAVVNGWLDSGASIVGGCCGIGPEHITEIADLVRSY